MLKQQKLLYIETTNCVLKQQKTCISRKNKKPAYVETREKVFVATTKNAWKYISKWEKSYRIMNY